MEGLSSGWQEAELHGTHEAELQVEVVPLFQWTGQSPWAHPCRRSGAHFWHLLDSSLSIERHVHMGSDHRCVVATSTITTLGKNGHYKTKERKTRPNRKNIEVEKPELEKRNQEIIEFFFFTAATKKAAAQAESVAQRRRRLHHLELHLESCWNSRVQGVCS